MSDLASLSLFCATPEQVIESRRRTWPEWGGILNENQYYERYARLDQMEHAEESKMITWVLAPRYNPTTIDFKCSCETYRRKGLVKYPGDNEAREALYYGIAAVYAPPSNRGKKYGLHMMRLVHWVLAPHANLPQFPKEWGVPPEIEQSGGALFSILFTSIGEGFYRASGPGGEKDGGWQARSVISMTWEVPEKPIENAEDPARWVWLHHTDMNEFWSKDVLFIKNSLATATEVGFMPHTKDPMATVSPLPDGGVGSFHITRKLWGAEKAINMHEWGVKLLDDESSDCPTYATWSVDVQLPGSPSLVITRICATEETFVALLAKLQEVARKSKIYDIEIWGLPRGLERVAVRMGGRHFEGKQGLVLPLIKWYGDHGDTADIEWRFIEK
ncbi:hypothetical protein DFH29DRAFT_793962 [Suillus ampliporus]|nr:hypothetical protein DFH29DRAFT_793962 [Suillus ampliporus]